MQHKADDIVEHYKARLVARGFSQTYGIDYCKTFSLVARMSSIHILFSMAVNKNWTLDSWMLRMPSFMVILLRLSLWNNLQIMLFMGRRWCAAQRRQSMA